jgi:acyl transferase domain-containing protein/acyl-CoA synthetase (AMP-forming)/AMP-acid ligase II/acyl carrier protein
MLQKMGATGERALVLYPPGLEYVAAFFGCLYAGIVVVPAYPPRLNQKLLRLQNIFSDAQAKIALTTRSILSGIERHFMAAPELSDLQWLIDEDVPLSIESEWQEPVVTSDSLAFIQYTSGSTGSARGVMLSHGNLMHNLSVIRVGFQIPPETIAVFWLPSYHDMGLIGGVLEPMYVNAPGILMSPASFLQQPIRWLQAITRYKGTISGAPNFAYQLCVDRIAPEQRASLDLSSWGVAFCGAEPIRHETLERFAEAFEPCGFRKEAFYPCYGLAEATLLVSGTVGPAVPKSIAVKRDMLEQGRVVQATTDEQGVRTLVGCGNALLDQRIIIADSEAFTRRLPDRVGEIWVSGPSVGLGYWNRLQETEKTFTAYLKDTGEGPFLRTGDLGFVNDGKLFVTGRLKDLIIIRGRNHYPEDIERTVEQLHPALRIDHGAAFSVELAGEERLVVVYEVERKYRNSELVEVFSAIRRAVAADHELQVYAVVLVRTLSIPKTSSGKIKRQDCRRKFLEGNLKVVQEWRAATPGTKGAAPATSAGERQAGKREDQPQNERSVATIEAWLISHIAALVGVDPSAIDSRQPFVEYGLDSLQAVMLAGELENWLNRSLAPTLAWSYPNIKLLALHLANEPRDSMPNSVCGSRKNLEREPIAIIGIGCRLPGAEGPEAFWRLLQDGIDAITELPVDRSDLHPSGDPNFTVACKAGPQWGGFLSEVDKFDPQFFGISSREAARMDPQQRLLLEVAWEALEDSGQSPDDLKGTNTAVFVGISTNDYGRIQLSRANLIDAYSGTGNALSIAANRLSYFFDLRGPSLAIDTACSSSLVAVDLASKCLSSGECNLALAAGVNLILSPELTMTFAQARMMASDGRCKTFDAAADGYGRSEGCGVVILKRLSDALKNKDRILALIKGSAVNQDGRSNGLTAPNKFAQQDVIRRALEVAKVEPNRVSYVETHGTGTPLGDPIEVEALRTVYMEGRSASQTCALGSVKTNIGHLEAAAGIAGLIKIVLAMQQEEIPPNLHLKRLNPYISLEGTGFTLPSERQHWPTGAVPRLAGVSSFGFGGTNAHIILEEPPPLQVADSGVERPLHILTISARSESALRTLGTRYEAHLAMHPAASVADLCFTSNVGRAHMTHRFAVPADSATHLRERLAAFAAGRKTPMPGNGRVASRPQPRVVFLFTGQGSQYVGMGRRLFETQPHFRETLEQCDRILRPHLDRPILSVLYPKPADAPLLHETVYTQPALFVLEYALAELWQSWGVRPAAVIGHSVGEYVAACVAGMFSLEDGLKLIAQRARLMQALPKRGKMAIVFAGQTRVAQALSSFQEQVAIAAVNGETNTVISGTQEAVNTILQQMETQSVQTRSLTVSHAFHSPLMEPMLDDFEVLAGQASFEPLRIPLISNLTGQMLNIGEKVIAGYWRRHTREAVLFSAGMQTLSEQSYNLFVEIGPTASLIRMGKQCLSNGTRKWLPSLKRGHDDWHVLLQSLAELYMEGLDLDWAAFDRDYQRRRVSLPTYPFERERCWLNLEELDGHYRDNGVPRSTSNAKKHPLLGRHSQLAYPSGCHIWEAELDRERLAYLDDHQIEGSTVLPASVYVEMIQAAAVEAFGARPQALKDLELTKALFLPEYGSPIIQVILAPDGYDEALFKIYSRGVKPGLPSEGWTLHASGRVSLKPAMQETTHEKRMAFSTTNG